MQLYTITIRIVCDSDTVRETAHHSDLLNLCSCMELCGCSYPDCMIYITCLSINHVAMTIAGYNVIYRKSGIVCLHMCLYSAWAVCSAM